jgi:hypothetical protein
VNGPYVPSIVLGVALAGVAVLLALGQLSDISVDLGLVLPVGLVVTGALLVVGALAGGLRRRSSG